MGARARSYEDPGVSTADPSIVFVIKSLLNPVIVVLTLLACMNMWDESLQGPYFLVAVLGFLGAADFLGVGQLGNRKNWRHALRCLAEITLRCLLLAGAIWTLLHISGLADRFDSRVLTAWVLFTPAAIWCAQWGAQSLLLRPGEPLRRAVIVGVTEMGLRLESALCDDPLLRMKVVGYFEDRSPDRVPPGKSSHLLGTSADLVDYVLRNDINVVYVTLPMSRDSRVLRMLEALRDSTVSIYFVPDLFVFNLIQGRFDHISGIPLVAVCESPFFGIRGLTKRLCDMTIAGLGVLIVSPLLIVLAIGVRLDSRGSVVFKQKRYGLDGKEITVYKFRSMTVSEDGRTRHVAASRGDARVTTFGAFIRKTSLDELPQLFNVLEGSMSIVGPRPHPVAMNEQYRRLIPSYMVRHKVKPGITGWAQVNGYRGGDDLESMRRRIDFDLEYLRHWSLWLDLVILLKTMTLVLGDKRAY